MLCIQSPEILSRYLKIQREKGLKIGFVPTMGAIHVGHQSLIERSAAENDITITSIFVNPKQFNESKDLEFYPRPVVEDIKLLIESGSDLLFQPSVDGVYPEQFDDTDIELEGLDHHLEGEWRPGHFQGVAKVIRRFFDIVHPDRAYFGQKDFQQTVVVRKVIEQFHPDVALVIGSIIREANGLAYSSRNERLTAGERVNAAFINKALNMIKENALLDSLQSSIQKARLFIESHEGTVIEYLEAVDGYNMRIVKEMNESDFVVVVAVVNYGGVRLLDNIILKQS